jgi:hypothetical protein
MKLGSKGISHKGNSMKKGTDIVKSMALLHKVDWCCSANHLLLVGDGTSIKIESSPLQTFIIQRYCAIQILKIHSYYIL